MLIAVLLYFDFVVLLVLVSYNNNNNNNNQYIYKQRQSHAMSQLRWLATAVIFRPSDVSLGFAETWIVIAPATAETLEGGSRALVRRWRKPVDQWLSETAAPIGHSMTTSAAGDDPGCQQANDRDHSSTPGHDRYYIVVLYFVFNADL